MDQVGTKDACRWQVIEARTSGVGSLQRDVDLDQCGPAAKRAAWSDTFRRTDMRSKTIRKLLPLLLATLPAAGMAQHHHERSEEHTSELQSLMRISYAVFCLQKKTKDIQHVHSERKR